MLLTCNIFRFPNGGLSQAIVELDAMFGEGYAAAHPAVQASASFDLAQQLDRLIGLGLGVEAGLLQAAQGASH